MKRLHVLLIAAVCMLIAAVALIVGIEGKHAEITYGGATLVLTE